MCGLLIYRKLWYATKGYLYQGTDWLKPPKGRAIYPIDIARYIALDLPGRVLPIFHATPTVRSPFPLSCPSSVLPVYGVLMSILPPEWISRLGGDRAHLGAFRASVYA